MDRRNFFFKQQVTEGEMDEVFDDAELADQRLVTDYSSTGVLTNGDVTEHSPTADLTVDINNPTTIYDTNGQRIFWAASQRIDTSKNGETPIGGGGNPDVPDGTAIALPAGGNEKIITIVAKFARVLGDPRTDGLGATIQYDRLESFRYEVLEGVSEAIPATTFPAVPSGAMVLDHYRLQSAQTQIFNADLFSVAEPGNSQRSDFDVGGIGAHISDTEDAHSAAQTITGRLKIGASGAPDAQNLLQIISSTPSDFMEWEHTINNGRFTWLFDNLPMLEIRAPSTLSSKENPYIRILLGDGNVAYISARGILGANAGAGNGTRLRIDEPGKAVSFFSGPESVPVFDVPLTVGGVDISPVAILASALSIFGPSGSFSSVNFDVDSTVPATANDSPFRFTTGNAGNNDTLAIRLTDFGMIGSGGGFAENDATNGVRIRFDDSTKQAFIHSNTLASPTYDVPLLVAGVEPQEDHFSGALTAAQLPRIGDGRFILAHGHVVGATATLGSDHVNFATLTRTGAGDYDVTFDQAISDADYTVIATIEGSTFGHIKISARATGGFDIDTTNAADSAADLDFFLEVIGHA